MSEILYRTLKAEDIPAVSAMVLRVARAFIWEELTEQGRQVFTDFASAESIRQRQNSTTFYAMIAFDAEQPVGVIEVRAWSHISLLFIDGAYHQHGIGRSLMQQALAACQRNAPFITRVTVGASLYGVPFYEKMGFVRNGPRQQENGITYVPMFVDLPSIRREGDSHHQMP
jgi:predicted GNAT family N-acyltransferase